MIYNLHPPMEFLVACCQGKGSYKDITTSIKQLISWTQWAKAKSNQNNPSSTEATSQITFVTTVDRFSLEQIIHPFFKVSWMLEPYGKQTEPIIERSTCLSIILDLLSTHTYLQRPQIKSWTSNKVKLNKVPYSFILGKMCSPCGSSGSKSKHKA